VVLQFLSYKGPCQHGTFFLAEKLKYHRLKPGGVQEVSHKVLLAEKLKYHRLKPGGVQEGSHKVLLAERLKYHRLKPGGVHEFGSL